MGAALERLVAQMPAVPLAGDRVGAVAGHLADEVGKVLGDILDARHAVERSHEIGRLTIAGDAALGDALAGYAYAIHGGSADGLVALAPDAARRHAYAVRVDPIGAAWDLPVESVGGGQTWHVTGSLLALDHALAPLRLIDYIGDDMPADPRVTAADRRALAHGMAQMSPFVLADRERDLIATALARGRAAIDAASAGDGTTWTGLTSAAGWSSWRRSALDYSVRHERDSVARLFTLADLFAIGSPAPADSSALASWGGAWLSAGESLGNSWPGARPWEDVVGRQGSGFVGGRFVDASLAIADALARRRFAAALTPWMLAAALADVAYRAPLAFDDDWYALSLHVRQWSELQVDDFIAALTASGPLVVPDNESPRQ